MSLFIQSANALVSRVAQWVGAIPSTLSITATAYNSTTGVITVSAAADTLIVPGDFIGVSTMLPYTAVLSVSGTSVTVSDPDGVWNGLTFPTSILKLPSQSSAEIMACVQLCELKMRTIELPALRSDPYSTNYPSILTTDANGMAPIPADMVFPILFFQESPPSNQQQGASSLGPWIIYDRVGDRDIISESMLNQWYLQPTNVPNVIHGHFSEVGSNYQFVPFIGSGQVIQMYYYQAWNLLFTPETITTVISATGTVGTIAGAGPWTCQITGMTTNVGFTVGDTFTVTNGTGSLTSGGIATVTSLIGTTGLGITVTGGSTPTAGTVTNVTDVATATVQTNQVLQSWPEGYVYGSLHEYYVKRRSAVDAQMYLDKFNSAWTTVENQNNLGKWNGGNTRMTSIFQPRRAMIYAPK